MVEKWEGPRQARLMEEDIFDIEQFGPDEPIRCRMPDERKSRTVKFKLSRENSKKEIIEVKGYFTVGFYPSGLPGEVFINIDKHGHDIHGFADMWAIAISLLLQYGVPPADVYKKFKFQEFQPSGISGVKSVPIAKSLVDLVVRWMEVNLPPTSSGEQPLTPSDQEWQAVVEEVSSQ